MICSDRENIEDGINWTHKGKSDDKPDSINTKSYSKSVRDTVGREVKVFMRFQEIPSETWVPPRHLRYSVQIVPNVKDILYMLQDVYIDWI